MRSQGPAQRQLVRLMLVFTLLWLFLGSTGESPGGPGGLGGPPERTGRTTRRTARTRRTVRADHPDWADRPLASGQDGRDGLRGQADWADQADRPDGPPERTASARDNDSYHKGVWPPLLEALMEVALPTSRDELHRCNLES